MNKKLLLATITSVILVAGILASTEIVLAQSGDSDDSSPQGISSKLQSIAKIVENANARLDKIQAGFVVPPDDEKPPMQDALNEIKTQAQHALDVSEQLLLQIAFPQPIGDLMVMTDSPTYNLGGNVEGSISKANPGQLYTTTVFDGSLVEIVSFGSGGHVIQPDGTNRFGFGAGAPNFSVGTHFVVVSDGIEVGIGTFEMVP